MTALFFSYSHKDEQLRDMLEVHLASLKRQGVIEVWHDRRIVAGDEFVEQIDGQLEHADVILLLISPDFLASDYCYDIEMMRAMERHEAGETRVIPVILRPCDWHEAPFGKLVAIPKDGKAISTWPNLDEAFLDVVKSIKSAAKKSKGCVVTSPMARKSLNFGDNKAREIHPRSSNLRLPKRFTDIDKDSYLDEAFEFMVKFFEGSLKELEQRNGGLKTTFRRTDSDSFIAIVYREGKSASECRVSRRGFIGNGITYCSDARRQSNGVNENLSVGIDDQSMFLTPMMNIGRPTDDSKLTFEGAAEYYWSMLIDRLRSR